MELNMAKHTNATLHRKLHEVFGSGDLEAAKELIAEDAMFCLSAVGPLSEEYRGRDAIFPVFAQLPEQEKRTREG